MALELGTLLGMLMEALLNDTRASDRVKREGGAGVFEIAADSVADTGIVLRYPVLARAGRSVDEEKGDIEAIAKVRRRFGSLN